MNVKRMLEAARYREAKGDFEGADELERMARRAQIEAFVPQNVLESVHGGVGGNAVNGQLGGLHVEMNVQPPSQNAAAKEAAISIVSSGNSNPQVISQTASQFGADPAEVSAWVEYLSQISPMVGGDPNLLRQMADQSGNVQMNLATQNPGSNFQSWGITPQDIMWHEKEGHGGKLQSSPDEYLNIANPGADMPRGFGGGIWPQQYWTSIRDQFMSGQGPQEWGPNKRIWEQRVVPKARQNLQRMMATAQRTDEWDIYNSMNSHMPSCRGCGEIGYKCMCTEGCRCGSCEECPTCNPSGIRTAMSDAQDCLDNINACNDMLDDPMLSPKRKKQIRWELNRLIDEMASITETPRFVRMRPSMEAVAQKEEHELCRRCKGYGVYRVRVSRYDSEEEYCECPAGERRQARDSERIRAQQLKTRIKNSRDPFRMAKLPDPEIEQCMWCNSILRDGQWVPHHEKLKTSNVTHVMCPSCEGDNDWLSELEALREEDKLQKTAGWLDSIRDAFSREPKQQREKFYNETQYLRRGMGTDPNAWKVYGFTLPAGCQTECETCGKDMGEFERCLAARTSGPRNPFTPQEFLSYETNPRGDETLFFCSTNCLNERRRFVANRDT
jgi:hypothetical protein